MVGEVKHTFQETKSSIERDAEVKWGKHHEKGVVYTG